MASRLVRTVFLSTACVLTASLAGCVVAPAGPYYGYGYGGEVVQVAPPPPQVEYYGAPPAVGQIWIGGYWGWQAGRHTWIGGQWQSPRPGHRWVPHEKDMLARSANPEQAAGSAAAHAPAGCDP